MIHIVSDNRYGRGVLIEGHNISTNRQEYIQAAKILKQVSLKWKIRWSYTETNGGILGNQIADALAKKAASKSNRENLPQLGKIDISCWHKKKDRKTLPQNHAEKLNEKMRERKKLRSPNWCGCPTKVIDDLPATQE